MNSRSWSCYWSDGRSQASYLKGHASNPGQSRWNFVLDKVTRGQDFLRAHQSSSYVSYIYVYINKITAL